MMAALILATVLSLVYFVSTQRTTSAPAPLPISGASIATPVAIPVTTASDTTQTPPADAREVNSAAVATRPETRPEPLKTNTAARAAAKKAAAKTTNERKPAEEPKKEESKVGSILKKTGRILKKPFKF
jgi:hypothetical protein